MHSFELVPGFALKIEYVIDETELLIRGVLLKKAPYYKKAPPLLFPDLEQGGLSYNSPEAKFFDNFFAKPFRNASFLVVKTIK